MPSVLWRCWFGGRKGIWPVKNSPDRGLRSSPDLNPTLDDLECHITVNVSSTSNIIPSFIKIGWKPFWQSLKSRDSINKRKFKNQAREILDILVYYQKPFDFFDWLKNGRGDRIWKSSFLKLKVSDDIESHIVVNVSSTLTNTTIWFVGIVAALCFIVDVRTYVRMDGRTDGHFYRVY